MAHVSGQSRYQATLYPEFLDEVIAPDSSVRIIDAFVDSLDLAELGFSKVEAEATGRPPYDPHDLLKLYIYGYLNQMRSSRRLEREARRNVEVFWLVNRVRPVFKTIADFRKDHPEAIAGVCRAFIAFCRRQEVFGGEVLAIDGSKIAAVASRKQVITKKKLAERDAASERKIAEYLGQVLCDLAFDGRIALGELLFRDHLLAACNCSNLASINRQYFTSKYLLPAAERNKGPAYSGNRLRMILAEIRNGLEHRPHPVDQPKHLDITPSLALEPPARTHLIQIPVDIKLQEVVWVVRRPTRRLRLNLRKPQLSKVQAVHKRVNHPHRAIRRNHLVQILRIKRRLITRLTADVSHPALDSNRNRRTAVRKRGFCTAWFAGTTKRSACGRKSDLSAVARTACRLKHDGD